MHGTPLLEFSKDYKKVAVTSTRERFKNRVLIFNIGQEDILGNTIHGDHEQLESTFELDWHPNNKVFALLSHPYIEVYSIHDNKTKLTKQLKLPNFNLEKIKYSSSGKYLACLESFKAVQIINLQNQKIITEIKIYNPKHIKFIPKKDILVLSGVNKNYDPFIFIIKILEKGHKVLHTIPMDKQKRITSIDISPDGKHIICAIDKEIVFVEVDSGSIKNIYTINTLTPISKIQFNQTGKYILSLDDENNIIKLWINPLSNPKKYSFRDIMY